MRVPLHIVETRRKKISALLQIDRYLEVSRICEYLKISEATARRDLSALAIQGSVTRTLGGALGEYEEAFPGFLARQKNARQEKEAIARTVVQKVRKGGCYFFDAGTTLLAAAKTLALHPPENVTIVTNNLPVAETLSSRTSLSVHLLGGQFLSRQAVLLGEKAIHSLALWKFDAAFLSGEGMTREGIWNTNDEVVSFQRAVLASTPNVYFCLDGTKIRHATQSLLVRWNDVPHLITDSNRKELNQEGIFLKPGQLLRPLNTPNLTN